MINSNKSIIKVTIIVVCIATIVIGCNIYNATEKERAFKEEVKKIAEYFEIQHGYYLEKIPEWVSISPCPTEVVSLYHPQFLLVTEEKRNTSQGYYCYPFSSKQEAISCFGKLKEIEKSDFYLISQSIIYAPSSNGYRIEMLESAEKNLQ
jgi:hypothetical protein